MKTSGMTLRLLTIIALGGMGVLVENLRAAASLPTSQTALLGRFAAGPWQWPVQVGSEEFRDIFGSMDPTEWPAEMQGLQYFANGGNQLWVVRVDESIGLGQSLRGLEEAHSGLHALSSLSDLRLLLIPEMNQLTGMEWADTFATIRSFAERRRIFFILDPPMGLSTAGHAVEWVQATVPANARFVAIYYPYLQVRLGAERVTMGASGAMAGIMTANDAAAGIWDSPAGSDLPLAAESLTPSLSSADYDVLTINHLNGLRLFPGFGIVPWGTRTLDRSNGDNRFIAPVRTMDWVKSSLERAMAFTATEDNGEPLYARIRTLVETFLYNLYLGGAFQGAKPSEAYFVRCDATTTTQVDVADHRVNVLFGLAFVRPAEFTLGTLTLPTYDPARTAAPSEIQFHRQAGNLELVYPTEPGFGWQLEFTESPGSDDWREEGNLEEGDGAWRRFILPTRMGRAYYRLRVDRLR